MADPDATDPNRELALLGRDGYQGDREGLAIFVTGPGAGFIVSSDQLPGGTRVRLFRREGTPADPHDHSEVRTIPTVSDSTDGLEVSHRPLPGFPHGVLVMMNSGPRNFLLYSWEAIEPARSQ